jgi:hypothetical protein
VLAARYGASGVLAKSVVRQREPLRSTLQIWPPSPPAGKAVAHLVAVRNGLASCWATCPELSVDCPKACH